MTKFVFCFVFNVMCILWEKPVKRYLSLRFFFFFYVKIIKRKGILFLVNKIFHCATVEYPSCSAI